MAPTSRNKRARAEDEMRRPKKKLKIRRKQTDYHSSSDEDEDDGQAISSPLKPLKASSAALAPKSILKQSIAAVNEADTRPESG
jgi:mitochondrial fusion and transport protein UGO1